MASMGSPSPHRSSRRWGVFVPEAHAVFADFGCACDQQRALVFIRAFSIDGIEEAPVWRESDEERTLHTSGAFQRLQRAFFGIEAKGVNARIVARSEGGDEDQWISSPGESR